MYLAHVKVDFFGKKLWRTLVVRGPIRTIEPQAMFSVDLAAEPCAISLE